ncbi:MAG: DUF932 domain-containing protein [Candidatus Latescibacteria bacterium]|jgi:hypothetical protein|nr:DUF932 domain-containing protein [Candidatus Latescibacterota bacterium]
MKAGKTINQLIETVVSEGRNKRDFISDTRHVTMMASGGLEILDIGGFALTNHAHSQIAQRVQIPQRYYDRMRQEAPELLSNNVNHWFQENPEPRLIRTMNGKARAFLSNRYRVLDNYDLLQAIVPKLREVGCRPESMDITERKLYLKCLFPKIEMAVSVGDVVQAGLVISNSEIGMGSLRIEPLIYRLVCANGLIAPDAGLVKFHLGRALGDDQDHAFELYRKETIEATDKAFWMTVSDTIDALLTPEVFDRIVGRLRSAKDQHITDIPKTVELTRKQLNLTDDEQASVLHHLAEGGDLSLYGLTNAVTRTSQDLIDYDRATEMERSAWSLLDLHYLPDHR